LIDFIVKLSLGINEFLKMQCGPNLKNYYLFRFNLFSFISDPKSDGQTVPYKKYIFNTPTIISRIEFILSF